MDDINADLFYKAQEIADRHAFKLYKLERMRTLHLLFLAFATLAVTAALFVFIYACLFFGGVKISNPGPFVMAHWPHLLASTALVSFCWMYSVFDRDFRRRAKHIFMYVMARSVGLRYRRGGFMSLAAINTHHILPPYSRFEVEEGFQGSWRGFSFDCIDFNIMPVRRLWAHDTWPYVDWFGVRGIALRVELNKTLDHHTVLIPTSAVKTFLRRHLSGHFTSHTPVNLVYNRFQRHYTVLSTNPVEARYVFDPAVMERVIKLGRVLRSERLEISFRDREMALTALYSRNLFEIGHLLEPVSVLTIERALAEIQSLQALIETLELNPHAGLGAAVPTQKPARFL